MILLQTPIVVISTLSVENIIHPPPPFEHDGSKHDAVDEDNDIDNIDDNNDNIDNDGVGVGVGVGVGLLLALDSRQTRRELFLL